jgi:tyrosinase
MFSNSTFDGVGFWGDPENDFQIFTGGFKNITVAYPVPHNIRRNFTLQPFLATFDIPGSPTVDPLLLINTTFTKANVEYTINSFTGDYVSFQPYLENISGPHPGPHLILAGDMGGSCPFGMVPPACVPGMKWSSNGEHACSGLFSRAEPCTQIPCSIFTMLYVLPAASLMEGLTCTLCR